METDNNILFSRDSCRETNQENYNDDDDGNSNVWDDSVLIKAYDKAVNLAKEEVAKRLSVNTNKSYKNRVDIPDVDDIQHDKKVHKKWTIGSPCRAIYSTDGEVYEAVIIKIFHDTEKCLVKFVGYDNVEKVELSSLCPSNGLESQLAQRRNAEISKTNTSSNSYTHQNAYEGINKNYTIEDMEYDSMPNPMSYSCKSNSSFSTDFTMPPAPPLPPQMMARLPENDADALSSMLMSWYISGFHTGYYHGIKQANKSHEKRKKN